MSGKYEFHATATSRRNCTHDEELEPCCETRQILVSAAASVSLSGHRAVVPQADGTLIYADPFSLAHFTRPLWLTRNAIMIGTVDDVLGEGEIVEASWTWGPGAIYLDVNGTLSQTPPAGAAFTVELGAASDATSMYFSPKMPIRQA